MSHEPRTNDNAVDDRPARTSTLALAGLVGLLVLAVGVASGSLSTVCFGAVSGGGIAAAIGWIADDRPWVIATSATLGLAAGCGLLVAGLLPGARLASLAAALAAFGTVLSVVDAPSDDGVLEAVGMFTYPVVVLWLATLGVALVPVAGELLTVAANALVPANAGPDLFGFAFLVALAVLSVRSAVRALPVTELAPKDDRDRIAALLDQAERALTKALWISFGGLILGIVFAFVLHYVELPTIVSEAIASTAGTPVVRGPLFVVALVAGTTAIGTRLVDHVGRPVLNYRHRAAAATGGLAFAVGIVAVHPLIFRAIAAVTGTEEVLSIDSFVRLVGLLAALDVVLVLLLVTLLIVPFLVGVGLASDRAVGHAIASSGLLAGAVATASNPPLVVALVVGALVAWDVGEFAVRVGQEVGRDADTTRVEAIHAAGSVGVAVVAALVAGGAYALVQVLNASGRVALVALAIAVVGTFLLAATLRG
jgi:hypothetical protein